MDVGPGDMRLFKYSMETALLQIQNDILMALDFGKSIILVLLDLLAAFDTIDHETLVSRLQIRFGIQCPALQWFGAYLVDLDQVIYVSGEASDPVCFIYGIPQRLVLGTLKFIACLCAIYDIAQRHGISIHQHADDIQLYLAFDLDNQKEATTKMEACLNDIGLWM